ncbi:HlyD family efflux transporter periplasmic adaptor subunit [Parahaliea maris]|uniref:HlyD family efflux transporter periplasmic adaptor subunit n=1 Tax=Parahaliea maris TaxID=2716870 RepID=A0A5C9A5C5_9GAMM|nr:efflux RND transporter periplasmic adaptor subunit [Parahaliea maris]TXS96093.1 HlyD family efflux transporter periplasmic adaptor subunit [Parahaliea maris]
MTKRLLVALCLLVFAGAALAQQRLISSLGRIEPAGGLIRLAGPSGLSSVLMELRVDEGDSVEAGQVLAVLNEYPVRQADLRRLQAELENARSQLAREKALASKMASAASKLEGLELEVKAAQAAVSAAEGMLDLALVRAPISGQVLYVHTRPGERVGPEGVLELGDTSRMYAVAEVYETDILNVKPGQRASVRSPALAEPVAGTVERIGLKVGRMVVLGMDPVAEADARVIEVDILLDEPETVRALTNLQVEVEITPG